VRRHSNRTVETINLVPGSDPKLKRCPSIPKGKAGGWEYSVGRGVAQGGGFSGVQCMSQSCNMAAHQWLPGGDYCTVGRAHY